MIFEDFLGGELLCLQALSGRTDASFLLCYPLCCGVPEAPARRRVEEDMGGTVGNALGYR